ncbi:nickel-responsive transcriptional regulator NikR [Fuchsiella alkaliacetigena]|uniref:nickel-responsive transcriptional regulator NikR n=1 Tax=Fuchsiella alkaliacetigena TaxID=957042 RepID=UPI00200B13D8|nr:nickel-responsive transcriptional regulator NikR [Fuchsiella alkaliacetigena]MCK8823711.1 nickel-responsive transcriptional regulator NikR [Fuchsiella alkaliacetigena]
MSKNNLIRFGISMNEDLLENFDDLIVKKGYSNRSEAIRDLIRNRLVEKEWKDNEKEVAGTITLVYDHHVRGLSGELNELQHDYHDLFLSTMHVHLDHNNCLEVLVVKGKARETREVAEKLIGHKGVKHGKLTITSTGKDLT